jgi:hypothetical protein
MTPQQTSRRLPLGARRGRSAALNQSNRGALGERFLGLKPALEKTL